MSSDNLKEFLIHKILMAMFFMEKYEFLIKKYIFYQCKHKIKKEMLRESIEVKEAASMIVRLDV